MPLLLARLALWATGIDLGGIARTALSMLLEVIKTPIGAAVVTGLVVWPLAGWHGGSKVEARYERASAIAKARAEGLTAGERRDARADEAQLVASIAARAAVYEEISHAPLPTPRPDDRGCVDGRRLR